MLYTFPWEKRLQLFNALRSKHPTSTLCGLASSISDIQLIQDEGLNRSLCYRFSG